MPPASQRRVVVLVTVLLLAALATVLILANAERPDASVTEAAPPAPARVAEAQAGSGAAMSPSPQSDKASATATADRQDLTGTTQLVGVVERRLPGGAAGRWPGGGRIELHPRLPQLQGGFMGMMGEAMLSARGGSGGEPPAALRALVKGTDALASTDVDARGGFQLVEPPVGEYRLLLRHSTLQLAPKEGVEVEVVEATSVDVGTLAAESAAGLLVLVSGPTGQPVGDASVTLGAKMDMAQFANPDVLQDLPGLMQRLIPRQARTDARGVVRFVGLTEPEWSLLVTASDLEPQLRPVSTPRGRETVARVELDAGATLRVTVRDARGELHAHARLRAVPANTPMSRMPGDTLAAVVARGRGLRTGDDGVAEARGLPPGATELRVRTVGFLPSEQTVQLVRGATAEVEVQLDPGVAVAGHVVGEDGAPLAGARVLHVAMLGESVMGFDLGDMVGVDLLSQGAEQRGVETGADGAFELGGFQRDEEAHLVAVASGHEAARQDHVAAGTRDVELRLLRSTQLTGRVVADEDGAPVEEFEARLQKRAFLVMDRPLVRERVSGAADGAFTLDHAPRESLELVIEAPGFAPLSERVDLREATAAGAAVDAGTLRLQRPAAVEGTVLDPDGVPVEGALVRIAKGGLADAPMMASFTGQATVKSDARGQFRLEGLRGRRVRLLADKRGFAPHQSRAVALEQGTTLAGVVLQLDAGGVLTGHVVDEDGAPQGGFRVQVSAGNGRAIYNTDTDGEGAFELRGLGQGTHKVEAFPPDFFEKFGQNMGVVEEGRFDLGEMIQNVTRWRVEERVVVRAGETTDVELVFEAPEDDAGQLSTVHGEVRVGGDPLPRGMVAWYPAGSAAPAHLADVRDGAFELPRVRAGSYRVQVRQGLLAGDVGRAHTVHVPETAAPHRMQIDLPGGRLAGRVVRANDGQPVASVVVALGGGDDATAGFDREVLGEGSAMTDGDGRFAFPGLAPGTYSLHARDLGLGAGAAGGAASAGVSGVALAAGERRDDLELALDQGGGLRITVQDTRGPRGNAFVMLLDAAGSRVPMLPRQLTDVDGVAAVQGLPAGRYRVLVDAPRAIPHVSAPVEVRGAAAVDVEVRLQPGVEVRVRVTGTAPPQLAGAVVQYTVWNAGGTLLRSGQAVIPADAASLPASLGMFAPGRYRVQLASRLGVYRGEHEVEAPGPAEWQVDAAALSPR